MFSDKQNSHLSFHQLGGKDNPPPSVISIVHQQLDLLLTFAETSIEVREDPARLRPVDVPLLEADTSRLRADTNWKPAVQFESALLRTLDFWRKVVTSERQEDR